LTIIIIYIKIINIRRVEMNNDNNNIISNVEDFATLISGIEKQWDSLYDEIHNYDLKQCDLLHKIENSDRLGGCEGYKLYKELRDLRKERRLLKNRQAILEPLYEWALNNKKIGIDLYKVKSSMDKIKSQQDNWTYVSRTKDIKVEI
jgi:hypothetical protein